jgi:dsDNA-specific endonuclease/ATPase MutS2
MAKIKEVDLHLEAFINNISGLSSENMVQLSLNRMRDSLDNAIEKGHKEIRFIHGHGAGTLRERVYFELRIYKRDGLIESFEPSFFNPAIVNVTISY